MTLSHMQEVQDNVSHSNSSRQTTTILAQQSALSLFKSGLSVKDSLKLITKWVFSCASYTSERQCVRAIQVQSSNVMWCNSCTIASCLHKELCSMTGLKSLQEQVALTALSNA